MDVDEKDAGIDTIHRVDVSRKTVSRFCIVVFGIGSLYYYYLISLQADT